MDCGREVTWQIAGFRCVRPSLSTNILQYWWSSQLRCGADTWKQRLYVLSLPFSSLPRPHVRVRLQNLWVWMTLFTLFLSKRFPDVSTDSRVASVDCLILFLCFIHCINRVPPTSENPGNRPTGNLLEVNCFSWKFISNRSMINWATSGKEQCDWRHWLVLRYHSSLLNTRLCANHILWCWARRVSKCWVSCSVGYVLRVSYSPVWHRLVSGILLLRACGCVCLCVCVCGK